MKQLTLRFATTEDVPKATEWLNKVPQFDPGIVDYKTFRMLASCNGEPVAYLPFQTVYMLESLALKPELDSYTAAQAARDMVKGTELLASGEGISEIYFLANDSTIQAIAEKNGFEELPWKCMRLKL